jgi:hypothetical protein
MGAFQAHAAVAQHGEARSAADQVIPLWLRNHQIGKGSRRRVMGPRLIEIHNEGRFPSHSTGEPERRKRPEQAVLRCPYSEHRHRILGSEAAATYRTGNPPSRGHTSTARSIDRDSSSSDFGRFRRGLEVVEPGSRDTKTGVECLPALSRSSSLLRSRDGV